MSARTEIRTAAALVDFLRPMFNRRARTCLGSETRTLAELCALAMGAARPNTAQGADEGHARALLVRAFDRKGDLAFAGDSHTIAVWRAV